MKSTATWRSMGRPGWERKSGWCRAMCARRSICTTKSGTAAAAGWKGAGRSLPVGEYARTTSARNGDDHPLITGQRRCSIVGRLEDQVDRLPRGRVRGYTNARGKGAGVRERDLSWIGAHIRPLPPPHRHGVPVGIGHYPLQTNRLARTSGDPGVAANRHPGFMIGAGVRRSHRPPQACGEVVLRGRSEVRVRRRWPPRGRGPLLEFEQVVVGIDRSELARALKCRAVQATSGPAAGTFLLVSEQSVVEQVQECERVAFPEEFALGTGPRPHDVALRLELVSGVS